MTAMVVKTFRKTVVERRRLYLDYSCWLEPAEELTEFQVTTYPYTESGPLRVDTGYTDEDHRKMVIFVSGGIGHTNYVMQMVARTDAGQVKRDDIGLVVLP